MLARWIEWFRSLQAGVLSQYPWLEYVLEIALLVAAAWMVRAFVMTALRRWAARTQTEIDDQLVALLDRAIKPALLLGLLAASLNVAPLAPKFQSVATRIVYLAALGLALVYGSKVLQLFVNHWLARSPGSEAMREPVRFLARVVFAGLGIMVLLDNLGISLTAVWTTLGVGSVAVALALQDTLSNFFSGVYIRLDSPARIGDYIKLDTGDEGFVLQLGWRSTRIRTLPNNIIVVPNSKLASAVLTNYSMPEPQMSLLIRVGVSYASDPEQVEKILVDEAARAAGKIEGLLATPAPFVRFIPGFGDSSLDFTLICRVNTFVDQYLVQHELRKRIFARLRRERIEIPFPQRDVHFYPHQPLAVMQERA